MKKKILSAALATTMVIGSTLGVVAETASTLTVSNFSGNTGLESISGNFDVTYTLHQVGGSFNNSFLVELRDAENNCIDARSDNWGWTYTSADGVVNFTDEQKSITLWPANVENGWTYIQEQREAGVDAVANIKRIEDTFYFEFTESNAEGSYVTWTYTIDFPAMASDTTITLSSDGTDGVTMTNIKFVDNNIDTSDITSDVTTYAQYKKVADNNYTVRVVSEVALSEDDIASYSRVGFRCSKLASQVGDNYFGKNIYKSIKANGETKTAADGKYFVVLEIKNVTSNAVLYVQPLSETASAVGTMGNEVTVNMANILN